MDSLQSGIITFRGRKIPLYWSGEKAEHLAVDYTNQHHVHPYLHVQAQQLARRGKIFPSGNRHVSVNLLPEHWVVVPLLFTRRNCLICSCFIHHLNDTAATKKYGGVGKLKKKKYTPADFEFTADEERAAVASGLTVESVKNALCMYLNGAKPLNKKK